MRVHRWPAQERVHFGPAATALAEECADAARVFVLSGRSSAALAQELAAGLDGRAVGLFAGIPPHSPRGAVIAAAEAARAADADLILAIGGGSVIDAAKGVVLALGEGLRSAEALGTFAGRPRADPSRRPREAADWPRLVAVPTTFSAAEFTWYAGITDEACRIKELYSHPYAVPRAVVLDPAATRGTPLDILLGTGMKAIDHAVERLCALPGQRFTDAVAGEALALLAAALPAIQATPGDPAPRAAAQEGMWLSILGAAAGTPVGASHALGHALGAHAGIPHGHTTGLVLPAVLKWNAPVNAHRQERVASLLGGAPAEVLRALVRRLGLPTRLAETGLARDALPAIAAKALHDPPMRTNPRPVGTAEEVLALLETAW